MPSYIPGDSLADSLLGGRFTNHVSVQLMRHASILDLAHFEEPEFYDKLKRARRQTMGRMQLMTQVMGLIQDLVTLVTLTSALIVFSPWLLLMLVLRLLPSFLGETHFASPDAERYALHDVSFELRPGERIALIGENGAGKTTITKLIARLYDPTEGEVLLDGVDLREYDVEDWRREVCARRAPLFRVLRRADAR